jgi:nitroreductase
MNIEVYPSINLIESLKQRRAVRSFLPDSIPEVILHRIIDLSCRAPSAFNLQPWRFIVLKTKESKEKLKACAFNQKQIIEAPVVLICCGDRRVNSPEYIESVINLAKEKKSITDEYAQVMRDKIPALFENKPCFDHVEAWTNRHTMIAVSYIMVIAQSFGLDSCPMEGFSQQDVRSAFNIPQEVDICCILCLGYAGKPDKKFGGRFPLSQVCFGESYGEEFK